MFFPETFQAQSAIMTRRKVDTDEWHRPYQLYPVGYLRIRPGLYHLAVLPAKVLSLLPRHGAPPFRPEGEARLLIVGLRPEPSVAMAGGARGCRRVVAARGACDGTGERPAWVRCSPRSGGPRPAPPKANESDAAQSAAALGCRAIARREKCRAAPRPHSNPRFARPLLQG